MNLTPCLYLCIFTICLLSKRSSCADPKYEACIPKNCGTQKITFPFYIEGQQESYCGHPGFNLSCRNKSNNEYPILHLAENDYIVDEIFYRNRSLRVYNAAVLGLNNGACLPSIQNLTSLDDRFEFFNVSELVLLTNCTAPLPEGLLKYRVGCVNEKNNRDGWGLAMYRNDSNLSSGMEKCHVQVVAPVDQVNIDGGSGDYYMRLLRRGFILKWVASNCSKCEESGGRCGIEADSLLFKCYCSDRPHSGSCKPGRSRRRNLILATVLPGALFIIIVCVAILIIGGNKNKKLSCVSSYLFRRNNTSSEPEGGGAYFGVPVFSYKELEEATHSFDSSRELGDGGFGAVYHGKLRDGREVAVKRLYDHNYKRVEQFMNEIEILTRLRHRNLVLLYGSTSHHSRELLLVYEYIPNGTVADHLHGDRAKTEPLTWPIRMNIAIQTASALSYLHASDIIHRDVKTNNILLDSNFCVKVADFGLSRLFPTDATHVSTAPQGTPGYVDPEYHQCYQLTDKSDVYSFGVVLIELISSMPAVDINRHRHEINLANYAIQKIQKCKFSELIDPSLEFESDATVERMTTSVAELAFRCLQLEKEMRPTMDEVLKTLEEIQGFNEMKSVRPPPSPESENVVLLKTNKLPDSPVCVADRWVSSRSNTSNSIPVDDI